MFQGGFWTRHVGPISEDGSKYLPTESSPEPPGNTTSTQHTHTSSVICPACYTAGMQRGMVILLMAMGGQSLTYEEGLRLMTSISERYSTEVARDMSEGHG